MVDDCGDMAGGEALLHPAALAAAAETEGRKLREPGEPSSRSSYSRYFLAAFFFAFFFAAIVISLRVIDWLHVQTAIVSALPMHRSRCGL